MKDAAAAKAERPNAEVYGVDEPTTGEDLGPEEESLDQSVAAGESIEQPAKSSKDTTARPSLRPEDLPKQPALPVPWDSPGPLAEGAPQRDSESPPYASVPG
jgi:hypothetical protein